MGNRRNPASIASFTILLALFCLSKLILLLMPSISRTRSCFAILLIVIVLLALTPRLTSAASSVQPDIGQHVLVRFEANTTLATRDVTIARMGGQLVTWIPQINVAEIRLLPQDGMVVASALSEMESEAVTFVEADLTVRATYEPNDPDFSDMTMRYGLDHVQALDAWDVITGSEEIVIAVVDSGIKVDHPEFVGRLVPGYDFIDDDTQPDDGSGHGTHVAGVIAAALDNGQGVAGVCPACRLMPVKVLNASNLGSWSQLAAGIIFAVDNGARVLNLSLGSSVSSETVSAAIEYAVDHGVLIIAAAGNFGSDRPFYPAALEGVVAVGATTMSGERWAKSDYGSYIDLTAPGDIIYSTFHDLNNIYQGYTYMTGTSMAAPFVSGVAGLLMSVKPSLTASQVTEAMLVGADDLGPTGWDAEFGYGRVNAMNALTAPVQGLVDAVGDVAPPREGSSIYLPALNNN
jgi:thermitase